MITIDQLTDNLKSYITLQVDNMATTSPIISFMKPLITRALDNNFNKLGNVLELIADKDGNIDIENIITEMMQNVINTKPFVFSTSVIGDIEVGGGQIKINLPFTSKRLVLDNADLETFREMITVKK